MGCGANKGNKQEISNITLTQQLGGDSDKVFQQKHEAEYNTAQKTHLESGGLTVLEDGDVYLEQPAKTLLKRLDTFEPNEIQIQNKPGNSDSNPPDLTKTLSDHIRPDEQTVAQKQNSISQYTMNRQDTFKLPPIHPNRPKIPLLQGTADLDYIDKDPGSFDFDFLLDESSHREERRNRDVIVNQLLEDLDEL